MSATLRAPGLDIDGAPSDPAAARLLSRAGYDLVLAAADPDDPEALELLRYARRKRAAAVLLFLSRDLERKEEALRLGAAAVLCPQVAASTLRKAVARALGPPASSSRPVPGTPGSEGRPGH